MPQTAAEAAAWGWTWLAVECLACRRKRDIPLADIAGIRRLVPLGVVARKLYCSACSSRTLEFALGAFEQDGHLMPRCRRIDFQDTMAVRPPRE